MQYDGPSTLTVDVGYDYVAAGSARPDSSCCRVTKHSNIRQTQRRSSTGLLRGDQKQRTATPTGAALRSKVPRHKCCAILFCWMCTAQLCWMCTARGGTSSITHHSHNPKGQHGRLPACLWPAEAQRSSQRSCVHLLCLYHNSPYLLIILGQLQCLGHALVDARQPSRQV